MSTQTPSLDWRENVKTSALSALSAPFSMFIGVKTLREIDHLSRYFLEYDIVWMILGAILASSCLFVVAGRNSLADLKKNFEYVVAPVGAVLGAFGTLIIFQTSFEANIAGAIVSAFILALAVRTLASKL